LLLALPVEVVGFFRFQAPLGIYQGADIGPVLQPVTRVPEYLAKRHAQHRQQMTMNLPVPGAPFIILVVSPSWTL
jgi:hypothetical protein